MEKLRWILLAAVLAVAACQAGSPGQTRSTLQTPVNDRELEPVNSLPPGFTTNHPLGSDTGVIGVTRAPP